MSMIDPIEKSDSDIDQRPFEIEALAARHRAERDLAIQERERLEKEVGLLRGAEHERDMLRDLADVLVVKVIEHPTGRTFVEGLDDAEIDDRIDSIIEAIDRRLMPEGYEWPRYESGELVRIGDKAAYAIGVALDEPVASVEFFEYGLRLHCGGWQAFYGYKERVKRPAALAADGEPLEVGQTVWHEDGTELRVAGFKHWEDGEAIVAVNYVDGPTIWSEVRSLSLTHTKPEPSDSWERIEEDIGKNFSDYWGCKSSSCANCSATVDGKTPYRRFGVDNCIIARNVDLVRRCRALAERERGE